MRAGFVVSLIGHVGAVMMTLLAWETRSSFEMGATQIVPVEIVNIGAEANVRALAQEVPDEDLSPQEEQNDQSEEARPQPASTPAPPNRRPPRQRDEDWDPSDASGLVDHDDDRGRPQRDGQPSDTTRAGVGLGTDERITLQSRADSISLRVLNGCWRTVADMRDPERLVVVVRFRLNRNGSLNGQPTVVRPTNTTFDPEMSEAVRRATSAVRVCDQRGDFTRLSEDRLVGEHYELWRDQEVEFGVSLNAAR
ncbi:MAG: hypothetical protein AB7Q23_06455 [Hyphomonadaceae bacterium]